MPRHLTRYVIKCGILLLNIDLELDEISGHLKKTKLVTEMEAVQQSLMNFGLSPPSLHFEDREENKYQLGTTSF
jgi:hypothetical protein